MDPKFWKDPENFRPERFLDAENKIINSQRVIAFGLGMLLNGDSFLVSGALTMKKHYAFVI